MDIETTHYLGYHSFKTATKWSHDKQVMIITFLEDDIEFIIHCELDVTIPYTYGLNYRIFKIFNGDD